MGEGEQIFDCPPVYQGQGGSSDSEVNVNKGFIDPRRIGEVVNEEGHATGHTAKLELVRDNTGLEGARIDPEGEKRTGDLASPDTPETKVDYVEEYLKTLFRKFSNIKIYRATEINKDPMGNPVDFTIKPGEYVYFVPREQIAEVENLFDNQVPALNIDNVDTQFSRFTGQDNDNLEKNHLGFSRKLAIAGKTFEIKFMCLNDGTSQVDQELPMAA